MWLGPWGPRGIGDVYSLPCLVERPSPPSQKNRQGSLSATAEQGRRGRDGEQARVFLCWTSVLALAPSSAGFRAHLPIPLPDLSARGWGGRQRGRAVRSGSVARSPRTAAEGRRTEVKKDPRARRGPSDLEKLQALLLRRKGSLQTAESSVWLQCHQFWRKKLEDGPVDPSGGLLPCRFGGGQWADCLN